MTREVELNALELFEFADRLEGLLKAVPSEMARAFDRIGIAMRSQMQRRFRGTYNRNSPFNSSQYLRIRSGEFRDNIDYVVSGRTSINALSLLVFYTHPAARVHEEGTVGRGGTLPDIRPKKAKSLTIPLPAAMDPSGIPRFTAREALSRDDVFFIKTRKTQQKGHVGLIVRELAGGRMEPLFLLARKVAIPPRLGFVDTWRSNDMKRLRRIEMKGAIDRSIRGAIGGRIALGTSDFIRGRGGIRTDRDLT